MITTEVRNGVMTNITAAGRIWDPAAVFVGVATAIVDNGINTVAADITQPTGAPGTNVAVTTWGTAYDESDGRRLRDGPPIEFRPANSGEATTVVGWALFGDDPPTILLAFGFFDEPIPLPDENSQVTILPRVVVDPSGEWNANVVID